jgi:hypothetical protein
MTLPMNENLTNQHEAKQTSAIPAGLVAALSERSGRLQQYLRVMITSLYAIAIFGTSWVDFNEGKFDRAAALQDLAFGFGLCALIWGFLWLWKPFAKQNSDAHISEQPSKLSSKIYFGMRIAATLFVFVVSLSAFAEGSGANWSVFQMMLFAGMSVAITVFVWYAFFWLGLAAIMALQLFGVSK